MDIILQNIREKYNLTKDDMAAKLGITRQTYYKYESGDSEPTIDIVRKIASEFNVDYGDIIENKIPQNVEYNIIKTKNRVNNKSNNSDDIRIDIPQENAHVR